jgi:hypothetical protein
MAAIMSATGGTASADAQMASGLCGRLAVCPRRLRQPGSSGKREFPPSWQGRGLSSSWRGSAKARTIRAETPSRASAGDGLLALMRQVRMRRQTERKDEQKMTDKYITHTELRRLARPYVCADAPPHGPTLVWGYGDVDRPVGLGRQEARSLQIWL